MDWPSPETVTKGITSISDAESHQDHLNRLSNPNLNHQEAALQVGVSTLSYAETGGWTYARAIQQAMVDIANRYGDCLLYTSDAADE